MKKLGIVLIMIITMVACKKNMSKLSFSERNTEIRNNYKLVVKGRDTLYEYDPSLLIGSKIPIFEIEILDNMLAYFFLFSMCKI